MKLSIITVCYNSASTIRDTIESVFSQDYGDIEYILVDGGSKDGTQEIIKSYGDRISHFVSEPDKGIYDAMNKGVALATGDVIGILNSDDFYESSNSISSVVKAFERRPESDAIFGDVVFVNAPDLQKVTRFYRGNRFIPWKLRFGWMPPHPATFIRKSAYQKVGSYALKYKISADYEFFIRFFLVHRLKYAYINKVLVRMRSGGASTAGLKSSLKLNLEIVDACRTHGIYTNIPMLLLKFPFKLYELRKYPK
ncbi:glycosyltransferase family 2 protein [Pseudomonas costantinii]|uniref:Glycosyl transferase n=1 Tax=Pseudomonas costantinii TaxID=168469 RepID=A0A1S2V475_9PSED|nr:glycosyltransferase family 2 protein [Pseudomonas costantinii]NVZ21664.1 glycosyltransferase [Pseudomonas costantinii]OIN53524.1 glycosyl transferase [Pseudomonas costantinii]SEE35946.1 Glycosyl transferase family 2 [Pseudomonas costantinii]